MCFNSLNPYHNPIDKRTIIVTILQMWRQRTLTILLSPKVKASKNQNLTPGSLAPCSLTAQFIGPVLGFPRSKERSKPVLAHKDATWNLLSKGSMRVHPEHSLSSMRVVIKKEAQQIFVEGSKIISI